MLHAIYLKEEDIQILENSLKLALCFLQGDFKKAAKIFMQENSQRNLPDIIKDFAKIQKTIGGGKWSLLDKNTSKRTVRLHALWLQCHNVPTRKVENE